MSDEQIKVEEKECNCICCKILKSDCTKKFLSVVLASFIGCSLALLVFAPKPHHRGLCPCPRMEFRMDRPLPPVMHRGFDVRPDFRGERKHFDYARCKKHGKDFRGKKIDRPDFRFEKFENFERPIPPVQPGPYKKPVQPVQPVIPE